MTTRDKRKQLWIGLVEARPLEGCDILDDAKGAFVNIVTWAADVDEFIHNAQAVLSEQRLFVVEVVRPEPVEVRSRREGDFDEVVQDMIFRAQGNPDATLWGTFHLYENDDA